MAKCRSVQSKRSQRKRQKKRKSLKKFLKHSDVANAIPEPVLKLQDDSVLKCDEQSSILDPSNVVSQEVDSFAIDDVRVDDFAHDDCTSEPDPTQEVSIFDRPYKELIDEQDCKMIKEINNFPIQKQCSTYRNLFLRRTQNLHHFREMADKQQLQIEKIEEDYKCKTVELHYFQDKVAEQQSTLNNIIRKCNRKIENVRLFWRDKVYKEHSRAGTIFKNSLCYN